MKKWLRRIRGALGMGLTWAVAWAVVGGGVMEGIVDPDGKILDMWPQTLAIPGFFCGVAFSALLRVAEGRRRFDELSLPRFGALGAATGLLLGALAIAAGLASGVPLWLRAAVILGPVTLLSAISASGTLALARMGAKRELPDAGADVADVGLTESEKRELLGGKTR
jgi:hypothetical protein